MRVTFGYLRPVGPPPARKRGNPNEGHREGKGARFNTMQQDPTPAEARDGGKNKGKGKSKSKNKKSSPVAEHNNRQQRPEQPSSSS